MTRSSSVSSTSSAARYSIKRSARTTAIVAIDADLKRMLKTSGSCARLITVPGVGHLTSQSQLRLTIPSASVDLATNQRLHRHLRRRAHNVAHMVVGALCAEGVNIRFPADSTIRWLEPDGPLGAKPEAADFNVGFHSAPGPIIGLTAVELLEESHSGHSHAAGASPPHGKRHRKGAPLPAHLIAR